MPEADSTVVAHRSLEAVTLVVLRLGRRLVESGARAKVVDAYAGRLARVMGAEAVDIRSGYASLTVTVRHGAHSITRMMAIGHHGVNVRLDHGLRQLVNRLAQLPEPPSPDAVSAQLDQLEADTPRHPRWLVALAVGVACAAFARLLGSDTLAAVASGVGAAAGQSLRGLWMARGGNVFVVAAIVAFLASSLGILGSLLLGSRTVETASIAATLLLVPGVPTLNAQSDVLEGRPTLGSARAVTVLMVMTFVSIGIWAASSLHGTGGLQ